MIVVPSIELAYKKEPTMNNGAKKLRTLELERPDEVFEAKVSKEDMLKGIVKDFNMKPQKLNERPFMTVAEAMPELTRIAIQENLNLNIGKEFNEAVKEMDRRKLNR